MHVHDDAVRADRDRGPGQRQHQVAAATGVRRVHDHRQVRQPLRDRHRADVQGVPRRLLERPDAALAQHDVQVAALGDVLGGHQPLLDGGVHAALEHHRLAHPADRLQQREVLHVARADLQHVRVAGDQVHVTRVDHLGHHRQAGRLAHLGEDLQPRLAQALERVRRAARLVRAAAQQRRARGPRHQRGRQRLLGGLDCARAGDDGQRVRSDRHSAYPDDRALPVVLPAHQLVRRGDPHHVADPRHAPQVQRVQVIHVADQADDRPGHAAAHEGVAAGRPNPVDDAVDFRFPGLRRHHHDHLVRLQS